MSVEHEAVQAVYDDSKTHESQEMLDKRKLYFRRRVLRLSFRMGFEMASNGRNEQDAMEFFEKLLNAHYPLEG